MTSLGPHAVPPTTAAFSPNGDLVVVGAVDGTTTVWRLPTEEDEEAEELADYSHHSAYVNSINFSEDGKTILTAGDDHRVLLWHCDLCVDRDRLVDLAEERLATSRRNVKEGDVKEHGPSGPDGRNEGRAGTEAQIVNGRRRTNAVFVGPTVSQFGLCHGGMRFTIARAEAAGRPPS